jgi:hypothetical protein
VKPETVFLTEADMERAARVAYLRNSAKASSPNHRVDPRTDDYAMHFAGVRAELAVCRLFRFPLDERYGPDGDNGKPDLYVGEYRVEVKTAFYSPPIIKLNALTDFKSDVMVACFTNRAEHREASKVEIWGCVSRQRFLKSYAVRDFGLGLRVTIEQMSPITVLMEKAA